MSGFFRTWDEIAEYVTNTKGYTYLTNPSSWIEAFKETVGNSRYISVEDGDGVFYNPNGWAGVGENYAPTLETGVKNPPVVNTVITDLATGTAVVGETALATEKTGMFIYLSGAGVIATILVSMGIGVVAYEAAPEFFTDLSNAMFEPITGHHLTYAETEPFLRRKISSWLSTDEYGKPLTYIPEDIIERGYNFIKEHMVVSENQNNFPTAEFNTSGSCIDGNTQSLVLEKSSITLQKMQKFSNECAIIAHEAGYTNARPIDMTELYNKMQSDLDLSSYDVITYQFKPTTLELWNNNFVSNLNIPCSIGVNAYRDSSPLDRFYLEYREKASGNRGYNYKGTKALPNRTTPNISGSIYFHSSPDGAVIEKYDVVQNKVASGLDSDFADASSHECNVYVGYYVSNPPTGIDGLQPTENMRAIKYTAPLQYETATTDEYFQRNNVEPQPGARVPVRDKTLQERYPEWYQGVKVISYPNKNKEEEQRRYLPSTTPLGDTNTEKTLKHGVNNNDDNSYKENQDDNQSGKNTPNVSSADDVNNSTSDVIDDYNKSRNDPDNTPQPSPQPLPNYPTDPPTDNDGDSGDRPTVPQIGGLTASGMVSVYNPTKQQLIDFSGWLWSNNFLDNFIKLFANPMDAIIGLHMIYATPISSGSEHIVVGYLDSNVSSKVVTQQYFKVDCGTINIPEYYGNATDYEPYTTIHIYLPFIGIVPLKTNDVLGKQLHLEYGVDVMTGTCLAMLTTIKGNSNIMCYTFAGNCAVQIPISGGNYAQMITGLAGFIVGGVGAIATGNPVMALGAGASFLHGNVNVQHSGSIGSNAGACGTRIPYVLITRKVAYDAQNYQHYYGFPSNNHVTLGTCKGYTQVKSCHVETIGRATDNEKTEIETLLKNGIIIV